MKILMNVLLVFCFSSVFAGKDLQTNYRLNTDAFDAGLDSGKTLITGLVLNSENQPMNDALVASLDFKEQVLTDSLGRFELLIPESDSAIFAFKTQYSEVIFYHDFKSQHHVDLTFFLSVVTTNVFYLKPVIYCYTPEPLSVNLKLGFKADLSFTYPTYTEKGWDFCTSPNGNLTLSNSAKVYPYLFWEAENTGSQINSSYRSKMVQINTDTAISYLESTLTAMGFNEREQTDFITFWGPKIQETPFAMLHFMQTESYESEIASLLCSPKPDNILRVFLLFTPLDEENTQHKNITPKYTPIARSGFTLIEWGGTILPYFNSTQLVKK